MTSASDPAGSPPSPPPTQGPAAFAPAESAPSHAGTSRTWRDVALIVFVCVVVYWVFLGVAPFASSEGHRVVPGWTMLDSGDWSRTEMFGLNYVRKPPGMPWAIAAASWLLGQTELAARVPSALACTLMALVAFAFGRVWCGPKGGLAAGLAQALLPLMWGPGRSAEIEALNTFWTQLAVLPLIALTLPSRARELGTMRNARRAAGLAVVAALGILGFALTKSAASVPCVVGAVIGVCMARRSARPLACAWMWGAVLIGAAAAYFTLRHFTAINDDPDAVRETGRFAFKWVENPARVVMLIPMALFAALPASLALFLPFGGDARAEGKNSADAGWSRCVLAARACAFAWAASCLIYAAIGVDNPRYLMPASVFLAPIVGYVIRGMAGGGTGPFARAGFAADRRGFVKRLVWRGPAAWAGVLVGAAFVINVARAMREDPSNGRIAGAALARALPNGATLWADDLIEARPDVLLYAQKSSAASKRNLTCVWAKPRMHRGELPAPTLAGGFVVLRTDGESGEGARYQAARDSERLRLITEGTLGKYTFALFHVTAVAPAPQPSAADTPDGARATDEPALR